MRIAITEKCFQKLNSTITHQRSHSNFFERPMSELVMEKVDISKGLERIIEICVKTQVN